MEGQTMGNSYKTASLLSLLLVCASQTLGSRASVQGQTVAPRIPGQISAKEAEALEKGLDTNPNDLTARTQLITYYFQEMIASRTPELEEKRVKHVLWLIEHHPESELAGSPEAGIMPMGSSESMEGYQRGKQLWLEQVENHPDSQRILRNAAEFLLLSDRKISRELLEKAWALDPSDAQTSSALAQSYDLELARVSSSDEIVALAKKALSIRERALEKTEGEQRFYGLGDMAKSAFEAGEPEKAQQYASELLQLAPKFSNDWNYGNALHEGNIVLGRIALQRGDIEGAKEHLLAAGQTPGSPQLDSFGPNMTLAKDLLEKGERDTVLAYLQSCAKFWKMGGDNLQASTATIKGGGTPDFGANLDY
jgi:tetratricopeptide (TPR) repeat protein